MKTNKKIIMIIILSFILSLSGCIDNPINYQEKEKEKKEEPHCRKFYRDFENTPY